MTTLDWIAIICLATGILFFLFSLLFLFFIVELRTEKKKLSKYRTKNKKKRKKLIQAKRKNQSKLQKSILFMLVFLVVGLAASSGAAYTIYYQATNLSELDQKAIVDGYYYLTKVENQLNETELLDNTNEVDANLDTLSSRLSAFALNKADYRISEDGQQIINRYYTSMKELGINLSSQSKNFYKDEEVLAVVKKDIEKVKNNEKAVFKQFKIDEKALAQQK
ncbi:hypothetical protein [Enterococcus rivorum]|uniref:Uncharacterized protein n=1 Tax=Enterococcus rivorum TaxID=762845 RepID=A0A1E5KS64_9ENTE|nr:hypothetical protein [Enterococcus rivorum]MBP2097375.1 Ca2+/Na+ antiporter [Enterococcus rivorum]OEH80725.1 hypothetical protein BCR26_06895 [Enterococcus rivorum]